MTGYRHAKIYLKSGGQREGNEGYNASLLYTGRRGTFKVKSGERLRDDLLKVLTKQKLSYSCDLSSDENGLFYDIKWGSHVT